MSNLEIKLALALLCSEGETVREYSNFHYHQRPKHQKLNNKRKKKQAKLSKKRNRG